MSMKERMRSEIRRRRWLMNAQELEGELLQMMERVFDLIKDEQEDWECDEWRDGCPPKPIQHPLFEVALELEDAIFLAGARVRKLQGEET